MHVAVSLPGIVVAAHFGLAAVLSLVWAWIRPAPPARRRGRRGPTAQIGNWAYWATQPVLRVLQAANLSPNFLTLLGLGLAIGGAAACAMGAWGWAGLLLLWSGLCDMLDGELARANARASRGGALLDSVADRLGEIAVFIGISRNMQGLGFDTLILVALSASLMVSYARARGEGLNLPCPHGGFERPGRVVTLLISMMSAELAGGDPIPWVCGALAVIAVGATGTALMRVVGLVGTSPLTPSPRSQAADLERHADLYRHVVRSES